jgi:4-amino-4-deoxy-L-arabinose transferase-like glycosyltransferase
MLHFGQDLFPWKGTVLAIHVLRFMTISLGAVAVYAIYRAAMVFFQGHGWAPLGVAAVIGLNPSFIFMSSTVHHDTLQAAIFALAIWWALRFLDDQETRPSAWLGGILVGAALLTKLSGLVLAPAMVFVIVLRAWQRKHWQDLPHQSGQLVLVAMLVASWWYLRNLLLYGDPFGWEMFLSIHSHMVRSGPYTWYLFTEEFLGQIQRTFWGAFGYMHITFPEFARVGWWLSGFAGLGLIMELIRGRSVLRSQWPGLAVALAILLLLFASFVRFSIATLGAGHGRYLFPAGFTIGTLLIAGLNGLFSWRYHRFVSALVAAGMTGYAVWLPVNFVLPKYTMPRTASREEITQAKEVGKDLTQGVRLVAYDLPADRISPRQELTVKLFWEATGSSTDRHDPKVLLELLGNDAKVFSSVEFWPVPSLPPESWQAKTYYVTQAVLAVPQEEIPGQLQLSVTTDSGSRQTGQIVVGSILTTGGATEIEKVDIPLNRIETFAGTLRLLASQMSKEIVAPGDVLMVKLYWQILEPPRMDYTMFIHVVNGQGELIAQYDRPAGGSATPTSTWETGLLLRDTYPVAIPQDASEGRYTVRTGMYIWPTLEPVPITIDGMRTESNFIDLDTVQVSR